MMLKLTLPLDALLLFELELVSSPSLCCAKAVWEKLEQRITARETTPSSVVRHVLATILFIVNLPEFLDVQ